MKKDLSTLVPLALLGAAFVLVSLLVVLTRAHPWFVNKKLRLGALIIGINAVALGTTTACCYDPGPTCYDPMPQQELCLVDEEEVCLIGDVQVSIPSGEVTTLTGRIDYRESSEFSFRVLDAEQNVRIARDIEALDGAFDQFTEEFEIVIDGALLALGSHRLELHVGSADDVAAGLGTLGSSYQLQVE